VVESFVIKRLLIANRGEIALRIIRACRELGIESVAVYSEADTSAPHVAAADRAIAIGPAPAADSYLSIPRLVDAARESRADAVHPGYGFLSENAEFARACEAAGLVFVGPPADVIAAMGSKIAARTLMQAAGVPVVPGETPDDQTDAGLRRTIERVGLPVLVKASAGGGGKGMRLVRDAAEIAGAMQAARREAAAAFGDGTLYVERLVDQPRHIEVQVIGDHHGRIDHVFERECSVQRRHQKIIEESPSPALSPAVRARITGAAVTAAAAAGYRNAGTIEFLLEGTGDAARFYFLEMNTRLQVEHPVTESVAGVDLVRAQLLVASGEPLPWTPQSLTQRGHAIEARVYAEDPSHGFLPQAGRLLLYREPRRPGVRIDAGVVEGGDISVYYDPMMAKVIASAETRGAAIARLSSALREFPILGIRTNIPFLLRILDHPRFRAGAVDTGFLDNDGAVLADEPDGAPSDAVRAAIAAHRDGTESRVPNPESRVPSTDPWSALQAWGR
jgi:3-methylcrotonyl-CoA carboxylase alpha subunit